MSVEALSSEAKGRCAWGDVVPPFDVPVSVMGDCVQALLREMDADMRDGNPDRLGTQQAVQAWFESIDGPTTLSATTGLPPTAVDGAIPKRFAFLVPGGLQRLQFEVNREVVRGCTLRQLRAHVERLGAAWTEAHDLVVNDLLPFVVSGARIVVLGDGPLLKSFVSAALQFTTACFYVLDGRPDLPLEGLAHGPNATSCGQRFIDTILRDAPNAAACRQRMRLTPDSGAASVIRGATFVLTGAFAATRNGAVVHRAGSLQVATLAEAMNVPLYVLCESYKYRNLYPLSSDSINQPRTLTSPTGAAPISAAVLLGTDHLRRPTARASPASHRPLEHTNSYLSSAGSATQQFGAGGRRVVSPDPSGSPPPDDAEGFAAPHALDVVPGELVTFFFTDRRIQPPSAVVADVHVLFPPLHGSDS